MKKLLITFVLVLVAISISAKTSYVATYFSKIVCDYRGVTDSILGITPEISYSFNKEELVVTILHEELDAKTIKSIKRAKANAGWAAFAAGMNVAFADRRDVYSLEAAKTQIAASESYSAAAEKMQHLGIEILVENNSEKEMYINDTARGTIHYIRPKGSIVLPFANPGQVQLRIANAYPDAPDAKYFCLTAYSTTEKKSIAYEDFDCIVLPMDIKEGESGYMEPSSYVIIDKITRCEKPMTKAAFEEFRKENKEKEKDFKDSAKK